MHEFLENPETFWVNLRHLNISLTSRYEIMQLVFTCPDDKTAFQNRITTNKYNNNNYDDDDYYYYYY